MRAPRESRPSILDCDRVVGRRFLRVLDDLLEDLRRHHDHPNRSLFYDDVVVAHLLAFFNPALRGLRSIQELFDDPKVRKSFGSPRVPRSTLADAQRMFDPALLTPLIRALQQRLGTLARPAPLDELTRKLLAVDGSFFAVAPRIAWALYNQSSAKNGRHIRKGNVRLHTHFDILRGIPDQVGLTDGQASEAQHLRGRLEGGCFYVMDRGFQAYQLLGDILTVGSDFLVRLRKSAACQIVQHRSLAVADQAVGIVEDADVRVGWRSDQTPELPWLRRVVIRTTDRRGRSIDIVLLTNRLDLPAHVVALLYQHRWQVELFFRWLKCMAHFEHFFSESLEGMTLQVYVTIIATLLIALHTGSRPSKYDYALMSSAILGWTSIEYVQQAAARRRGARTAQKNDR
jgi:hypothetical protein